MTSLEYRCSAAPRIISCPASAHGDGVLIDEDTEISRVGTCGHAMAATMIADGAPTTPNPAPYLQAHNVEQWSDDIDFLAMQACRLWHGYEKVKGLKLYFPHAQVEIRRSKTVEHNGHVITLSGHLDVSTFIVTKALALVLDWKMGYKSDSGLYLDQMKGYAYLQCAESKQIKKVMAIIGWLRDGTYEVFEFSRADLATWAKKFFTEDIWWDGQTYNPGWACQYCPRRCSCPGITAHTQELAIAFGPSGNVRGQIMAMTQGRILPADIFNYSVQCAKFLKGKCEQFLGLAKRTVDEHGPFPVPGEPGKAWGITIRKGKTTINVPIAWPIISEIIPNEQLGEIVSVAKGKLEKSLGTRVKKGKGVFIKTTMKRLADAGAITVAKDAKLLEIIDVEEK